MKEFGEWLNNPTRRPRDPAAPEPVQSTIQSARDALDAALPDGMTVRLKFLVPCRSCERDFEWPAEPELYEHGVNNYCGGSPRCCP